MIPLATTTIDILRDMTPADDNEYDSNHSSQPVSKQVVTARGIRACINTPLRPREDMGSTGTEQVRLRVKMQCDPCDLTHLDEVRDNKTGLIYNVMWVLPRAELGIKYMQCEITLAEGTATGTL